MFRRILNHCLTGARSNKSFGKLEFSSWKMEWRKIYNHISNTLMNGPILWMEIVKGKSVGFFFSKQKRQSNGTQIKNKILFKLSCNCCIETDTQHEIVCYFMNCSLYHYYYFLTLFFSIICVWKQLEIKQPNRLCVSIRRFVRFIHNMYQRN